MTDGWYVLDENRMPIPASVEEWARWSRRNHKHVALTEIGDSRVSTVFLGLDHSWTDDGPPVLWETMVFGGELDGEQVRYTSDAEAKRGHDEMVGRVTRIQLPTVKIRH